MQTQPQNFKNHVRIPPRSFMFVLIMLLMVIILSVFMLFAHTCSVSGCSWPVYISLIILSVSLFLTSFIGRSFALKSQDRAIRAEENLRHFVLTGKLLSPTLTISQIVALRFAADEEFVELAKRAESEQLTNKEIKMAIQHWRADCHRV